MPFENYADEIGVQTFKRDQDYHACVLTDIHLRGAFPPRQEPGSFSVDAIMAQLEATRAAGQ